MHVLIIIDGAVQGQGIKLSANDWLNIGSETWAKTPDKDKAAAYQAVITRGWKNEGLLKIITDCWQVDEDMAQFTIETLKELSVKYPVIIEEVYKDDSLEPVFKIAGCDKTIPFPN